MSWLFGMNKGQPTDVDLSAFQLPTSGGGDSDDKSKDSQGQKTMEAYRFDSAALERAAKAAKELERSCMHHSSLLLFTFHCCIVPSVLT